MSAIRQPRKPRTVKPAATTVTVTSSSQPPSLVNNFPAFADLVMASFQSIVKQPGVFVVNTDADALYAHYLAAFPAGTNPLIKQRTEHDCSCCKQFIRRVGNVVAVEGANLVTVWDGAAVSAPFPYNVVATAMRDAVRAKAICDIFRVGDKEGSFGAQQTRNLDPSGVVAVHNHFYTGEIPKRFRVGSPDAARGEFRAYVQVFQRGLVELSPDAIDTVLSLIDANNLYRGEEHKRSVAEFQHAQRKFAALNAAEKHNFVWTNASSPAARFRNTVVGTLVQDLSSGMDVDAAVRSFETKVAPQNYKRTSAVITPMMIKKAMETIAQLGLEPALERRFAVMSDISVRDVLWVDGAAKPLMKGGIGDVLMQHATTANSRSSEDEEKRAEQISLDDFVAKILPETTGLELLFKNEQVSNLMALTAPVLPEPKQLFRWGNDFAWSYCGNVADSIRERVKKAGGRVEGATLRISLSWFNYDDLDLHVYEPAGRGRWAVGDHIYFGNKTGWTGGTLDVDMNAGGPRSREAVENVVWARALVDGAYRVVVNNFNQRESIDPGFVVEIESGGKLSHYAYNKTVRDRQDVAVVTLHVKDGVVASVEVGDPTITSQNISQEKWGLKTEQYVKVNAVTLSPNYWQGSAIGNKHTFFVVDGAKCDEAARGIYNEFLHPRLETHRKVFEVIGDKTKCQPVDGALCGLGFSSTKKDSFVVRVQQGKKRRLFNVYVGA